MAMKPDLSDFTSKFDLDKILGGIKSMINPEGESPAVDPNDALGLKIAQLSALFQEMAKSHAELAKEFAKANEILNGLFKDLESVRGSEQGPKTESEPEEKPPEEEKKDKGMAFAGATANALIMSYVLVKLSAHLGVTNMVSGATLGFWLWLGFILTCHFSAVLWAKKSFKAFLIDASCMLVTLLLMGGAVGLLS